jgi:hypothetical protein
MEKMFPNEKMGLEEKMCPQRWIMVGEKVGLGK